MNQTFYQSVNHRIVTVAGLLKRQIFRIIAENKIEITPEQWVILSYLWNKNGLTISELVERSKKDFANVTRIVEKLQKQEYVIKKKNKNDGRSYLIYLTDKATDIKTEVEKCWQRSLDMALIGIPEEEQDSLLNILQRIEDNITEYLAE